MNRRRDPVKFQHILLAIIMAGGVLYTSTLPRSPQEIITDICTEGVYQIYEHSPTHAVYQCEGENFTRNLMVMKNGNESQN